jgi:hypothetical protein
VEEVSYRSKSIEGVSTTTTGFVGPTRYGPVEIEPEVITNVTEFERVYGKGGQLNFSDTGPLHNYLWHGVRAFFEEGGKRLYVARVFRPSVDPDNQGYVRPRDDITLDTASLNGDGEYATDGHARVWLTKATYAVSASEKAVRELSTGVQGLSEVVDEASAASDWESEKVVASQNDESPLLLAKHVVEVLGQSGPTGSETGVAKLLLLAKPIIDAAKAAFSTSTIDLAVFTTTISDLHSAAERAIAPVDNFSLTDVIVPAATAAQVSTANALDELTQLGSIANVVATKAAAATPPLVQLQQLADDLNTKCAAAVSGGADGGAAWQAFDAAKSAAATAQVKAADASTLEKRGIALTAAQNAVVAAKAAVVQKEVIKLIADLIVARAVVDGVSDAELTTKLKDLSTKAGHLNDATAKALLDAQRSAYPRAYAISIVAAKRDALVTSLQTLEQQAVQALKDVKGGPRPPADIDEAVLLRARFPGSAGNTAIRIDALLGQNILVADTLDTTKSTLRSVIPGDLVYIGGSASQPDAHKLYLAYPTADRTDWYFSEDGTLAGAKFWLNNSAGTKLDPTQHEVCIVTSKVSVDYGDGNSLSWTGLAFQPGHTRSGAADALTDKFKPAPNNGNDARMLPFAILTDKSVKNGRNVFQALMERDADVAIEKNNWPLSVTHQLSGGNDGVRPGADEYAGHGEGPDAAKTGLKSFEDVEDISIVAAPGAMFGYMNGYKSDAQRIISSLISHAENMKYRIAVLESGDGQSIADVREMRARYDSKYAALYYPWIRVLDPVTRDEIHLPPSGFVAGIYARNDIDRAVYKAPANEVVRGAIGFQTLINKAQQEVLNPEGVNCFRFFEGRGFRLWGARTISSDPEWKYVNVRRYFAYMERSIDRGTQWAVFEPNGEALWANVRETISDFLYNEWKNGALLGSDPKSAYFVRCDRSTMTQNDLDNGRLVCKIGVAALKPAEFVIFQIGQWTGDRKA